MTDRLMQNEDGDGTPRQTFCGDTRCHLDREKKMHTERDSDGKYLFHCDPCIVEIVRALNNAGLKTVASCCGHGFRPGSICLEDDREIHIVRNRDEGRKFDRVFPVDINGDRWRGFRVWEKDYEEYWEDQMNFFMCPDGELVWMDDYGELRKADPTQYEIKYYF